MEDLEPNNFNWFYSPETMTKVLTETGDRWKIIKNELAVFAAAEEDVRVRRYMGLLKDSVSSLYSSVAWFAHDLQNPPPDADGPFFDNRTRDSPYYREASYKMVRTARLIKIILNLMRDQDISRHEELLADWEENHHQRRSPTSYRERLLNELRSWFERVDLSTLPPEAVELRKALNENHPSAHIINRCREFFLSHEETSESVLPD